MSLRAQIERLKSQWDRRMRVPVDDLSLGDVNEEFAIAGDIEKLGERLDAEENPHGPRFHSSQWSFLSDEQRRRMVDLRVRADWLTSASHGDPRKRLKMKRELRKNKVDLKRHDWNNMTFREIEELMREHGLRVSSRMLMVGRVGSRFAKLNMVAPNAIKSLSIPENFDVWTEYKKPGIKVYSGGNDWEAPPTCFMLMKKQDHRGDAARLWVELNPPEGCADFGYLTDDEKSRGLDDKTKEKLIRENGEEFLRKWEEAARARHESSYEGAKGLPNSLDRWADALKETEGLHPYVSMSGSDRTEWKKTGLLRKARSIVGRVITCDRLRRTQEGEDFWQDMMKSRKKVSEREFLRKVDIEDVLDPGESWGEYKEVQAMQGDPIKFFRSGDTYFFQTAGFEFIWLTRADERRLR